MRHLVLEEKKQLTEHSINSSRKKFRLKTENVANLVTCVGQSCTKLQCFITAILYIQLTISFLIGQKCTANFSVKDTSSWSRVIMSCMTVVHDF